MPARITQDQWIERANKKHGNKYDYSQVIYCMAKSKVIIGCLSCGNTFTQDASSHLSGNGCPVCANTKKGSYLVKTKEQWIAIVSSIHPGLYDYSQVEYERDSDYVTIKCLRCGDSFTQKASKHSMGRGCPVCGGTKKKTVEKWIEDASRKHNGKYDYSQVVYLSAKAKVKIICMTCGLLFEQDASSHLYGCGCPVCKKEESAKGLRLTPDEWIAKAQAKHPGLYDYSQVEYKNNNSIVTIRCLTCGNVFRQKANNHTSGKGCEKCGKARAAAMLRFTLDEWIEQATKKHNGKYDYADVTYVNSTKKVRIFCKTCGTSFEQDAGSHMAGIGCPRCSESKGERLIESLLQELNVSYVKQKRFNGCRHKRALPFDFYLPDHNLCIEYHGEQHYRAIDIFGGMAALVDRQERDEIKEKFCKDNLIDLAIIPFCKTVDQVKITLRDLLAL